MQSGQRILSIRDRPHFTKCDRCVLNLLRPHLMQTEESNSECTQLQQILTQFKQALDQGGVISVEIEGQIQFMTPRAEHLLCQYFSPSAPQILPDLLYQWFKHQMAQLADNSNGPSPSLPLHIEQTGRRLVIHLIPAPRRDHYLLLLEEQTPQTFSIPALELLGLTQREAEVLFWIAKDKSNAGIARVLGCCEGTVRKHLEHVYAKLGARTRMGAVMGALEKLGLLKESFVARSL
jgi:DNA-binding CsgD family transcriptional regulator